MNNMQSSIYATKSIEEIAAAKRNHNNTLNGPQVHFQQVKQINSHATYATSNTAVALH